MKGWVPVGAPFGGCAATTWLSQLSGDFFKLLPIVSNALLPPSVTSKWHPTVVGKSIYKLAFGYPTWGWMLPRPGVFAKDHVSGRRSAARAGAGAGAAAPGLGPRLGHRAAWHWAVVGAPGARPGRARALRVAGAPAAPPPRGAPPWISHVQTTS